MWGSGVRIPLAPLFDTLESLREPRVRIGVGAFGKSKWAQVEGALAESAWYAATLLSGEMPDDIEEVFAG